MWPLRIAVRGKKRHAREGVNRRLFHVRKKSGKKNGGRRQVLGSTENYQELPGLEEREKKCRIII